jgi:hypothetical protein
VPIVVGVDNDLNPAIIGIVQSIGD